MKKIFLILLIILYCKNNIKIVKNENDIDVLVNKKNKLSSEYIPNDLVIIPSNMAYNDKKVRKEVLDNYTNLFNDALNLGFKITIISAYRSYEYQDKLFKNYVKEKGYKYASLCSAKAGFSEHQTGLSIDVMGTNNDYNLFEESNEFNWMKENAHKYGFILRYPKGKEKITGFKYEPWHYRYVGIETATYIYNNNLTLEEYCKK